MGYQRERDEFISTCERYGIGFEDARALLRMGQAAQRLAIAACNGDYPADNGERKVKTCDPCGASWAPSSFRAGVCPDCRIEQRIRAKVAELIADGSKIKAVQVQGDPRGYVVKLYTETGDPRPGDPQGFDSGRYFGVPARG
jgi:hypothetical protein